jgi:O-antigen/teichoic acid export membrane protein
MTDSRGQIGLTATVIVAAALPFLLTPWKAQALGPSGRGEVGYFGAAFTIILACAALGVRYAYYEVRSERGMRVHLKAPRMVALAYGTAGLATIGFVAVGARSMSVAVIVGLLIAWAISPVQLLTQTELAEAQSALKRKRVAALSSTPALFESVATLILLVVKQMTVTASIAVTTVSEVLRGLVGASFRRRDRDRTVPALDVTRRLLVLSPVGLLPILVANADTIVFAWFVPTAVLGEYSVAKLAINVMLLVALTIEGTVVRAGRRVVAGVVAGLTICAAVGALLGYALTPLLFGAGFDATRYAFIVTSVAGLLGALFTLVAARQSWNGRNRAVNVASVIAVVLIVSMSLILGVQWPGAPAWALGIPAIVSYGSATLIAVVAGRKGR